MSAGNTWRNIPRRTGREQEEIKRPYCYWHLFFIFSLSSWNFYSIPFFIPLPTLACKKWRKTYVEITTQGCEMFEASCLGREHTTTNSFSFLHQINNIFFFRCLHQSNQRFKINDPSLAIHISLSLSLDRLIFK